MGGFARLNRRRWSMLVGSGLIASRACGQDLADDPEALAAAEQKFQAAGLENWSVKRSNHFQAGGNAPAAYLARALTLCERLGDDYLEHFRAKGFAVEWPERRLTVIGLAGPDGFERFLGTPAGPDVGGIYDLDGNALVVFDARPASGRSAPAERVNTFTLMHEALHLLQFNTGLLSRSGDVPLLISEGLAMYGENRRATGRSPLGQVNKPRLAGLKQAQGQGVDWIGLERLFVEDAPFEDPALQQAAYAQAWLFVHRLMQDEARWVQLRGYAKLIRDRKDGMNRVADAKRAFGPLDLLDAEVRKHAARLQART